MCARVGFRRIRDVSPLDVRYDRQSRFSHRRKRFRIRAHPRNTHRFVIRDLYFTAARAFVSRNSINNFSVVCKNRFRFSAESVQNAFGDIRRIGVESDAQRSVFFRKFPKALHRMFHITPRFYVP